MSKWQTTVQAHSSGDGIIPIPQAVVQSNNFQSGDVFVCENTNDDTIVLRRAVRITRLLREWNKYQRRIKKIRQKFVVLLNGEPIAVIGPTEEIENIPLSEDDHPH